MTVEAEVLKKGIELTEKAIEGVGENLAKEGNKYKELLKYIRNIPAEIVRATILIGPNFVKFLLTALKSKRTDAKTKLLFTGIIVALSTLLGLMIWDISLITMLFAIGAFAGPVTIIGGIMFGSLIILIKSALTAFLVLLAMKLSNMMYEKDEIELIANEAFGKEHGKSFTETFNRLTEWDNENINKFFDLATKYFNKVGEKFENKDLSNIEEKISTIITKKKKKKKSTNDTGIKNSLLNQLRSIKRKNPLDEDIVILVMTLLYHAVSIDGEASKVEIDILINFIKEEYTLDDTDVQNFFNQINKEGNIEVLLEELQELLSKAQLKDVVKIVEEIISSDNVITNEEQLLLEVVKKKLL